MRYAEVLLMHAECCAHTNDNDGPPISQHGAAEGRSQTVSTSLTLDAEERETI